MYHCVPIYQLTPITAASPGNRLEKLVGERKGQLSIRINDQWRVCFCFKDGHATNVSIVDCH